MSPDAAELGAGFRSILDDERAHVHPEVYAVGSMLSYDERLLLHWATRTGNPTADAVVDAGCFLGGSTVALAGGVIARESGVRSPVHVYDLFRFDDDSQRTWVPEGLPFGVGESTLPAFEHHVRRVRPHLVLHRGDVRDARWHGGPVGVLFVDIAKTWSTADAVWREFLPALVPGESLVIQQDLVHWGHPWCAIAMELLADRFELLGWVWYSSAVYRCVAPVRPGDLPRSLLHDVSLADKLELLERAAERLGEPIAVSVRLAGVIALGSHGDLAAARRRLDEIRSAYVDTRVPHIEEAFDFFDHWIPWLDAGGSSAGSDLAPIGRGAAAFAQIETLDQRQ